MTSFLSLLLLQLRIVDCFSDWMVSWFAVEWNVVGTCRRLSIVVKDFLFRE